VLDFAGGTVVEVNSGIAGLVAALVVGRRIGYLHEPILPHNMPFCVMGAGMLWVGWLGFNGGSALSANGTAGMAALTTHLAGAAAGFVYMICEWKHLGKPSMLGIVTGAVAGLVAITPACGYVGPLGGIAVGGAAALASFVAITQIKAHFRYDDSLDVFGVHGVGGMVGLVLTGVFCAPMLGGAHANTDIPHQVWMQTLAMLITIGWSAVGTAALLYVLDRVVGLRPSTTDELSGLDLPLHGEAAYNH
jgi:Amt family ammonium transporter